MTFQAALAALDTPGGRSQQSQKVVTPLSEVIGRNLKVALANSTRSHDPDLQALTASPQLSKETHRAVQNTPYRLHSQVHTLTSPSTQFLKCLCDVCVCL